MNALNSTTLRIILTLLILASGAGQAAPRIAVLNFELNDITSLPNTPAERKRTASIRPLLAQALSETGDYRIIAVDAAQQVRANAGFGYLFRFNDIAAELGRQVGADWIVVGQHSKPSFLFSYLLVHLIDVKHKTLAADYAIELKGTHDTVTRHSVAALAKAIHATISPPLNPPE